MRATPRLRAYLRRFRKAAPSPAAKLPLPDNPYRRFFTPQRTLEELTRPGAAPAAPRTPPKD
ncbi:MAG: hypothetical protein ACLTWO_01070 [Blautia massiliensis (ex Durand et al. 2017)]